jgi:hypothetical protein
MLLQVAIERKQLQMCSVLPQALENSTEFPMLSIKELLSSPTQSGSHFFHQVSSVYLSSGSSQSLGNRTRQAIPVISHSSLSGFYRRSGLTLHFLGNNVSKAVSPSGRSDCPIMPLKCYRVKYTLSFQIEHLTFMTTKEKTSQCFSRGRHTFKAITLQVSRGMGELLRKETCQQSQSARKVQHLQTEEQSLNSCFKEPCYLQQQSFPTVQSSHLR